MISPEQVIEIVHNLYGLTGKVSALGSCQDINFKFTVTKDSVPQPLSYVVKFTNAANCTLSEIEFQHAVIEYLRTCRECSEIALPLPLAKGLSHRDSPWSTTSPCISEVDVNKVRYFVRMLTYVDGIILSEFTYFNPEVLHSFGAFVATISKSLVEFQTFLASNPQLRAVANREIEW